MSENKQLLYTSKKNASLPVYVHELLEEKVNSKAWKRLFYETNMLICCTKGKLYVKTDQNLFALEEGSVYFAEPEEECFYSSKDRRTSLKMFVYSGMGKNTVNKYLELSRSKDYWVEPSLINGEFTRIQRNMSLKNYFEASLIFQQLLHAVAHSCPEQEKKNEMEDIKRYMDRNFCEDLDNEILAELYGSSVSYFCRAFKKQYHTTPKAYMNDLRIRKACMLLKNSHKKVTEVAQECGYHNLEYFCSAFKKYEYCTPTEYRRQERAI